MAGRLGQGDLVAGGIAAALLVVAVALGVRPWLAIALALATYAGLVLLRSRRDAAAAEARRHRLAYHAALAHADALRALTGQIPEPAVRAQVVRVLNRIAQVLAVMREDDTLNAAPVFDVRLLAPFHALLTQYVRLSSREVRSAGGLLERTETRDLPLIEQAVDAFYEQLHRTHMIDLATLGELLELDLDGFRATTLRRVTP